MAKVEDPEGDNLTSYTLEKIAKWSGQGNGKNGDEIIKIPDIQRGFVWQPRQVEDLWDSLLKRLPIGSFLLHEINKDEKRYELLDGQQRATAIALGFNMKDEAMLWLDLGEENNDPCFRLVTKHHPWGYQRKDNTKKLTLEDRKEACNSFNLDEKDNHEKLLENKKCWPYDAYLPVPFDKLISKSVDDLIKYLEKEYSRLENKHNNNNKEESKYTNKLEKAKKKLESLKDQIKNNILSIKIPAIIFTIPDVQENDKTVPEAKENDKTVPDAKENDKTVPEAKENDKTVPDAKENDKKDPIEELFVRVNSAGTPLAGEELIYSIYKSIYGKDKEDNGLKDIIEGLGIDFVKNSKIVALSSLIARAKTLEKDEKTPLPGKVTVRNFRKWIAEKKEGLVPDFKDELDKFITEVKKNNIFNQAKEILLYKKDGNDFGIPTVLLQRMADRAHPIFFVLLYRLDKYQDEYKTIIDDAELRKRVVGHMTAWFFFGKGKNSRDHRKCLTKIWDKIGEDTKTFWESKDFFKNDDGEAMLPLPCPCSLKSALPDKAQQDDDLKVFIKKTKWDRNLLLYAQRKYIHELLKKEDNKSQSLLDDDETPWDYDHINPQSRVYKKKDIKPGLREWHNSIGNLMALHFKINRVAGDKVEEKLNSLKNLKENFLIEVDKKKVWGTDDLKDKKNAENLLKEIQDRYIEVYKAWYATTLSIEKLE